MTSRTTDTDVVTRLSLVGTLVLLVLVPWGASFLKWGGPPPGFLQFPPERSVVVPGFNPAVFGVGCCLALGIVALVVAPRWLRFQPASARIAPRLTPLAWWFWPGLAVMGASWLAMWFGQASLAKWSFTPLWWGFIVALDGFLYRRSQGRSLLATRPRQMLALSLVSIAGWYLFEYLNFFVLQNWYYPHASLLDSGTRGLEFTLTYTTVWPVVFEWYLILCSYPALKARWSCGPTLSITHRGVGAVLAAGLLGLALTTLAPFELFPLLWVSPLAVIAAVLAMRGVWTPFRAMTQGDWTGPVLVGLASLITGFFWESWNFGSEFFRHGEPANPNYWIYQIPYVDAVHLFSEMPLLGYFGYLPFGAFVWVFWLLAARLFGFSSELALDTSTTRVAQDRSPALQPAE